MDAVTNAFAESPGSESTTNQKISSAIKDFANEIGVNNGPPVSPVRIAISGASGNIGYSLVFRIASGQLLGPNVPVFLQLLELPQAQKSLEGVLMELEDCAFPLLAGAKAFDDAEKAFENADYVLLVGSRPRTKDMERKDLIESNAKIFSEQGKALNKVAKNSKVLVVGNPANTNAMIASSNAPNIPAENFSAMTRLDHNRGIFQLSKKLEVPLNLIEDFAIWGNHSSTQYPSISFTNISGMPISSKIDEKWFNEFFVPSIQKRGAAVIAARGSSSAASAANGIIDHVRDWVYGTRGKWVSAAVRSNGEYGITPGLFFSYPVIGHNGSYKIVPNLALNEFDKKFIDITHKELLEERDSVVKYLS